MCCQNLWLLRVGAARIKGCENKSKEGKEVKADRGSKALNIFSFSPHSATVDRVLFLAATLQWAALMWRDTESHGKHGEGGCWVKQTSTPAKTKGCGKVKEAVKEVRLQPADGRCRVVTRNVEEDEWEMWGCVRTRQIWSRFKATLFKNKLNCLCWKEIF